MNVKKIAVVVIALLAGGAAFYLTLSGEENSGPAPIPIIQAAKENTVGVLVASSEISRGDRLTADNLEYVDWPEKVVTDAYGYITDENDAAIEDLIGAVAKSSFGPGEPLNEDRIVRAGSQGLLAAIMQPGMRAIALRVTPETASGGFILPGDRVDVIFTEDGGRDSKAKATTIFTNVRVLAVNEVYTETPDTSVIDGVNITLEFTPREAEQFVAARSEGSLSLSLRSVFENQRVGPQPVEENTEEIENSLPPVDTKRVQVIRIGRT